MDNLVGEAERLYNKVKEYAKPTPNKQNRKLERMARQLYDDFRGIINPRTLEQEATDIKEFLPPYEKRLYADATLHGVEDGLRTLTIKHKKV